MAKGVKVSTYLKNVAKSFGYAGIEVFNEYNPTVTKLFKDTKETTQDLYQSIKDFTAEKKGSAEEQDLKSGGFIKNTLNNLKDDIRTGQWYNKSRQEAMANDMVAGIMGDDFDFDFDMDDDWGDLDSDDDIDISDDSKAEMTEESKSTAAILAGMDTVGYSVANSVNQATSKSASAIIAAQTASNKALYDLNVKGFSNVTKALLTVDQSVNTLVKLGEPLTAHMQNSATFFTNTTETLNQMNQSLKEIAKNTAGAPSARDRNAKDAKGTFSSVFGSDGLDISSYVQMIKDNISEYKDMADMGINVLKGMKNNFSLGAVGMKALVKSMIPEVMKESQKQFNEALKGGLGAAIVKGRSVADNTSNPILSVLLDMVLPKSGYKNSLNNRNYNKGKVAWDGVSRKALTEVIPVSLMKIYSVLSGTDEMRYDYDKGKFVKQSGIKREFNNQRNMYIQSAGGNFRDDALNAADKAKLSSAQKKDIERYFEEAFNSGDWESIVNIRSHKLNKEAERILLQVQAKYRKDHKFNSYVTDVQTGREDWGNYLRSLEASGDSIFTNLTNWEEEQEKKNNGKAGLFDTKDRYNHNLFFYIQGTYENTGLLANNLEYISGRSNKINKFEIRKNRGQYQNTGDYRNSTANGIILPAGRRPESSGEHTTMASNEAKDAIKNKNKTKAEQNIDAAAKELKEKKDSASNKFKAWMKQNGIDSDNPITNAIQAPMVAISNLLNKLTDSINDLVWGDENGEHKGLFGHFKDKFDEFFSDKGKGGQWINKLFGEKGDDGKRSGGFFSSFINETTDNLKKAFGSVKDVFGEMFFGKQGYAERKERKRVLNDEDLHERMRERYGKSSEDIVQEKLDKENKKKQQEAAKRMAERLKAQAKARKNNNDNTTASGWLNIYGGASGEDETGKKKGRGEGYGILGAIKSLGDWIQNAFSKTMADISGKDGKDKKDLQDKTNTFLKNMGVDMKQYKGKMGAGALIGAGASLLTGGVVGPLFGAAAGAGIALLTNSNTLQNSLFGEVPADEEGRKKYEKTMKGRLRKLFTDQMPSIGKGAGAGAVIGLLTGHPIIGAFAGSAVGFINSSDKAKEFLFGHDVKDANGIIKKSKALGRLADRLKKAAPNMAVGAGLGALFGPFGMAGNIIIGGALGFATTSNKFHDYMFGTDNGKGRKTGGLVNKIDSFFKNEANAIKGFGKKLGKKITRTFRRFWTKHLFKPLGNFLGKLFKNSKLGKKILKLGKVLDPRNLFQFLNNRRAKKNIKRGYDVYSEELGRNLYGKEYNEYAAKRGIKLNKEREAFNNLLGNTESVDQLDKLKSAAKSAQNITVDAQLRSAKNIHDLDKVLKSEGVDKRSQKAIRDALVSGKDTNGKRMSVDDILAFYGRDLSENSKNAIRIAYANQSGNIEASSKDLNNIRTLEKLLQAENPNISLFKDKEKTQINTKALSKLKLDSRLDAIDQEKNRIVNITPEEKQEQAESKYRNKSLSLFENIDKNLAKLANGEIADVNTRKERKKTRSKVFDELDTAGEKANEKEEKQEAKAVKKVVKGKKKAEKVENKADRKHEKDINKKIKYFAKGVSKGRLTVAQALEQAEAITKENPDYWGDRLVNAVSKLKDPISKTNEAGSGAGSGLYPGLYGGGIGSALATVGKGILTGAKAVGKGAVKAGKVIGKVAPKVGKAAWEGAKVVGKGAAKVGKGLWNGVKAFGQSLSGNNSSGVPGTMSMMPIGSAGAAISGSAGVGSAGTASGVSATGKKYVYDMFGNVHQITVNEQGEEIQDARDSDTRKSNQIIENFNNSISSIPGALKGLGLGLGGQSQESRESDDQPKESLLDKLMGGLNDGNSFLSKIFNFFSKGKFGPLLRGALSDASFLAIVAGAFAGKFDTLWKGIKDAFGFSNNPKGSGSKNGDDRISYVKDADGKEHQIKLDKHGKPVTDKNGNYIDAKTGKAFDSGNNNVKSYGNDNRLSTKLKKNLGRGILMHKSSVTSKAFDRYAKKHPDTLLGKGITKAKSGAKKFGKWFNTQGFHSAEEFQAATGASRSATQATETATKLRILKEHPEWADKLNIKSVDVTKLGDNVEGATTKVSKFSKLGEKISKSKFGSTKLGDNIASTFKKIGSKLNKKVVKVGSKAAKAGAKEAASKAAEAALGNESKKATIWNKLFEKLKKFPELIEKLANRMHPNMQGKGSEIAEKIATAIKKKLTNLKNGPVGKIFAAITSKTFAKVVSFAFDAATVANAFTGGADSVLGITKKATIGQCCIAALIGILNNHIPVISIIFDDKELVDIITAILTKVCPNIPGLKKLNRQRKEATKEVAKYNKENKTNLTIQQYNEKVRNRKGIVKRAGDGIKDTFTNIGKKFKNLFKKKKKKKSAKKATTNKNLNGKVEAKMTAEEANAYLASEFGFMKTGGDRYYSTVTNQYYTAKEYASLRKYIMKVGKKINAKNIGTIISKSKKKKSKKSNVGNGLGKVFKGAAIASNPILSSMYLSKKAIGGIKSAIANNEKKSAAGSGLVGGASGLNKFLKGAAIATNPILSSMYLGKKAIGGIKSAITTNEEKKSNVGSSAAVLADLSLMAEKQIAIKKYYKAGNIAKIWEIKTNDFTSPMARNIRSSLYLAQLYYSTMGMFSSPIKTVATSSTATSSDSKSTSTDNSSAANDANSTSSSSNKGGGFISKVKGFFGGIKNFFSGGNSGLYGGDSGFVSQRDPKYANIPFAGSDVGDIGCGPAVAAMASGGKLSMNNAISEASGYTNNSGTNIGYFKKVFGNQAHIMSGSDIADTLTGGSSGAIILGRDPSNTSKEFSPFGPKNHYVYAEKGPSGTVLVNDPELSGPRLYPDSILNSAEAGVSLSGGKSGTKKSKSGKKGKNKATDSSSSGSKEMSRYQAIWEYLKGLGYSNTAAAAIMGCWNSESSNKPNRVEGDYMKSYPGTDKVLSSNESANDYTVNTLFPAYAKSGVSINKKAYKGDPKLGQGAYYYPGVGIAAWTGPAASRLWDYAKRKGEDWKTLAAQMDFFTNGPGKPSSKYNKGLEGQSDLKQAVTYWYDKYEMGGSSTAHTKHPDWVNQRYKAAKSILAKYKGDNNTVKLEDMKNIKLTDLNSNAGIASSGGADSSSGDSSGSQSGGILGAFDIFGNALNSLLTGGDNSSSSGDSSGSNTLDETTPAGNGTAQSAVDIAKSQLGYLEKKSNKDLDKKTANVGSANYTKYNNLVGKNPQYWCAAFVSWVMNQAVNGDKSKLKKLLNGGPSASVSGLKSQLSNRISSTPEPGDIIIYKSHSHTGIVESVDNSGKTVKTIEGNTSVKGNNFSRNGGGVAEKDRKWSELIFARPNWNAVSGSSDSDSSKKGKKKTKKSGSGSGLPVSYNELSNMAGGSSGLLLRSNPGAKLYANNQALFGGKSGASKGGVNGGFDTSLGKQAFSMASDAVSYGASNSNSKPVTNDGTISVELFIKFIKAISGLLNTVANNTSPIGQIYDVLSNNLGKNNNSSGSATSKTATGANTTSNEKTGNNSGSFGGSSDLDIDSNIKGLTDVLAAIAKG